MILKDLILILGVLILGIAIGILFCVDKRQDFVINLDSGNAYQCRSLK
jgi:hypothetical protein